VANKQHVVIEVQPLASLPVGCCYAIQCNGKWDLFQVHKAELFGLSLLLRPTRFLSCGHSGESFGREYAFPRDDRRFASGTTRSALVSGTRQ
jgi:hypothetical protein